jgi:hypothetical protein
MKWLKLLLCVLFLATMVSVPTGCGGGGVTELKPQAEQPKGHEAGVKERSKDAQQGGAGGATEAPTK